MGRCGTPSISYSAHNQLRDLHERHNPLQNSEVSTGTRHSVDDAGCFILPNGNPPAPVYGFHSYGSVTSHTGHDDAHGKTTVGAGDRFHHYVDRWDMQMRGLSGERNNRPG